MMQPTTARSLTTDQLAARLGVKPGTIRTGLCAKGEYLGLRPTKLPNRRLLWDAEAVERLARGEAPAAQAQG